MGSTNAMLPAKRPLVIFGAGGAARDARLIAEEMHCWLAPQFIDEAQEDAAMLKDHFHYAVIGIGTPEIIRRVYEKMRINRAILWTNLIHPDLRTRHVQLGQGNIIAEGARFAPDVKVGHFNNINFNCTVGHDCQIENYCVVSPGANLSGFVVLEDEVSVGSGAVILPGLRIGRGARIGAGAVVTKDVRPGTTVIGVPAREMKVTVPVGEL
jgi:sugar O-acyltransferase (sialic acid O-acetyltransferase NeuD family)